jgi:hypothetical protein
MTGVIFVALPLLLLAGMTLVILVDPFMKQQDDSRWGAEEKAIKLLRSWLTPDQDEQFKSGKGFEVIGCDTGTRYRITSSVGMMNVHELDETGDRVRCWCFVPHGDLPSADTMLAQKIALETMERRALAVARTGPRY